MLVSLDVRPIPEPAHLEFCYHLFVIRSAKRDFIRATLIENEIECGIHYPVPLHLQPALSYLGYRSGEFPASEALADTALSLPMHPNMTGVEVVRTVEIVAEALAPARKVSVARETIPITLAAVRANP